MLAMIQSFNYGTDQLRVGDVLVIASGRAKAVLGQQAIRNINVSRQHVQHIVEQNKTVYGVNTGFGILANTKISDEILLLFNIKFSGAIV